MLKFNKIKFKKNSNNYVCIRSSHFPGRTILPGIQHTRYIYITKYIT